MIAQPWRLTAFFLVIVWALAIRQLNLEWSINPQYQYGWIVPFLTVLLWWRAWPHRPVPQQGRVHWIWPATLFLFAVSALPLRIIQEANPDWRVLNDWFAGQAVLLTAFVLYFAGGKPWLKYFAFPLLFPLIAVPWPSGIETEIIQGLQRCVASIGVEAASWLGWSALQRGSLIVLPHGIVGINEACSGIRSLQSSLMIALFLGEYFQLTTVRRWLLLILALALAFILNVARAILLMVVMDLQGASSVLKFHDPAGLSISFCTLLLLWIFSSLMARSNRPETATTPARTAPSAFSLPVLSRKWAAVLLVVWLLTEGLNQGWYVWHEQRSVPGPLWTLRWPLPRSNFREKKIDEVTENTLRYSEGLHGEWTDHYFWDVYFLTWKPNRGAAGLAQFHHPDVCLPASGFVMKKDFGPVDMDIAGVNFSITRYLFQDPFNGQLYYVFQTVTDDRVRTDVKQETLETDRFQRLEAAWHGHRNPGQRSLMVVNRGAPSLQEAQNGLQSMLQDSLVIERNGAVSP